jgi:drug/metabolite transporter (DMT)-like permease
MSLSAIGLLLAGFSALTSAMSHAFLKAGDDRLAQRVWSALVCAAIALPVAVWTGPLPMHFWPLMAGFALLSFVNQLTLIKSYSLSDFSHAYPVARGIAPLAMAVLGVIWLGDQLSAFGITGIVLITGGILALAMGRGMSRHGWGAAIFTGLTTVGYNILAANGMREAADPSNFIAWLFVTDGVLLPAWMAMQFRAEYRARLRRGFTIGWQAGLLTLLSYTALAFAMRFAPVGIVSAIRESSVLIALVLAAMMLNEAMDRWRILAGLLIVAGAVAIILE